MPHRLLLLVLLVLSLPSATGQTVPALAYLDSFTGATGTPLTAHTPELDPGTGDGAPSDGYAVFPSTGTVPTLSTAGVVFAPVTNSNTVYLANTADPAVSRTLTVRVTEPVAFASSVNVRIVSRFVTPSTQSGYFVQWRPGESSARVFFVTGVDGTSFYAAGNIPYYGNRRTITLEARQSGSLYSLYADGELVDSRNETDNTTAPGFAVAVQAPLSTNGGPLGVIEDLAVTVPRASNQVCAGLSGWQAETCIRDEHGPLRVRSYDQARDELFGTVWVQPSTSSTRRAVEGIYGGSSAHFRLDLGGTPREQVQDQGFNTEHVWPQSRGAEDGSARTDLHHLAPAFGGFNTARSNRAYGAPVVAADVARWLRNRTTYYPGDFPGGTPNSQSLYSTVERDFIRSPDDQDGYTTVAEQGVFYPRAMMRGDVARMAAYFLVMYRIEAEDGTEGRAFIEAMLGVLLAWHDADPVDAWETERNARILRVQGNANPFVVDPTLMQRALYQGAGAPRPQNIWINEIHHSNEGVDQNEGVEFAGPANADLYGWRIWFYSGYGTLYSVDGPGTESSPSFALRRQIDDEAGGLGAVWRAFTGLRSGCNGYALTDPDGALVQFLSTGGCQFNALDGPVFDLAAAAGASDPSHPDSLAWSTAIQGPPRQGPRRRVQEWNAMPAGYSVQLTGSGDAYADFAWGGPYIATRGRLNDYQAPAFAPNPVSQWKAGDDDGTALPVPAVDSGTDEDAPGSVAPPAATAATGELTVGRPFPNPATDAVRFEVALPGDAQAHVYDALGRRVLSLALARGARRAEIDVSTLAAGLYVVRVAAGREHVTHRFTVAR